MQQSVCSTERCCFHIGTGNTLCGYHACNSFGTGAHASKMSPLLSGLFPMQGRVTPFVDMRIVDDDGRELPRDGKAYGDLQVRGPHVIQRYYRVSLYHCCIPDKRKLCSTGLGLCVPVKDPFLYVPNVVELDMDSSMMSYMAARIPQLPRFKQVDCCTLIP